MGIWGWKGPEIPGSGRMIAQALRKGEIDRPRDGFILRQSTLAEGDSCSDLAGPPACLVGSSERPGERWVLDSAGPVVDATRWVSLHSYDSVHTHVYCLIFIQSPCQFNSYSSNHCPLLPG